MSRSLTLFMYVGTFLVHITSICAVEEIAMCSIRGHIKAYGPGKLTQNIAKMLLTKKTSSVT